MIDFKSKDKQFFLSGVTTEYLNKIKFDKDEFLFITLSNDAKKKLENFHCENYFWADFIGEKNIDRCYNYSHRLLRFILKSKKYDEKNYLYIQLNNYLRILAFFFSLRNFKKFYESNKIIKKKIIFISFSNNDNYKIVESLDNFVFINCSKNIISKKINKEKLNILKYFIKIVKNFKIKFSNFFFKKKKTLFFITSFGENDYRFKLILNFLNYLKLHKISPVIFSFKKSICDNFKSYGFQVEQILPIDDFKEIYGAIEISIFKNIKNSKTQINLIKKFNQFYQFYFEKILEYKPSSLILCPYGYDPALPAIDVFKKFNKKVFFLPLVGVSSNARGSNILHPCVEVLCHGEVMRTNLSKFNKELKYHEIGNVIFDDTYYYKKNSNEFLKNFCKENNLHNFKNKTFVLIATTGILSLDKLLLKQLYKLAREELIFIFKPHPSISKSVYEKLLNNNDQLNLVFSEDALDYLLSFSDCLITDFSYSAMHSYVAYKMVLIVNFTKSEYIFRWENEVAGYKCKDIVTLKNYLELIIKKDKNFFDDYFNKLKKNIYKFNFLNDSRSKERIKNLI